MTVGELSNERRRATRERPPPRSYPLHSSPLFVTVVPMSYGHLAPCASGTTFSISMTCHSECLLISHHMHSPPIHRRHYSGTKQEPGKDNVSWKTTRVLITDTLSHAYWLSPGGICKISRICRTERWNGRCHREWKTFKDIWIQRGCAVVIGDVNKPAIRMH